MAIKPKGLQVTRHIVQYKKTGKIYLVTFPMHSCNKTYLKLVYALKYTSLKKYFYYKNYGLSVRQLCNRWSWESRRIFSSPLDVKSSREHCLFLEFNFCFTVEFLFYCRISDLLKQIEFMSSALKGAAIIM